MDTSPPESWVGPVRVALERYDEALLRPVATRLCRPRNQWPAAELIDRCVATLENPAVVDRRLKDISPEGRRVLATLRFSGQPRWAVGSLCEIGAMLGAEASPEAILDLIQAGLVFPDSVSENGRGKIRQLQAWLTHSILPSVFIPPPVMNRLDGRDLGLQTSFEAVTPTGPTHEADGLEWVLRLGVLHQMILGGPLRRTQSREFFKRDLDRLRGDTLLGSPVGDALASLPDVGLFTVALGLAVGVLVETEGEIRAAAFPPGWSLGLSRALSELWSALPVITEWNAATGWTITDRPGRPFISAWLIALVLLANLPTDQWVRPEAIEAWIVAKHPYWTGGKSEASATGIVPFLLGVIYPLKLIQAAKCDDGGWAIRLSPTGKSVLGLGGEVTSTAFPQTLLVQPNLEILAYRQGLTPDLIARLGTIATWKTLGAACTLQFEPASVYHALETGETLESIVRTLDRHGMKPTPSPVLEALRTWANKRDRITVYPSAALFEFASAADLNEALSRGLPAVKVTDRLAVVPRESDIDYKNFRLTGTRDYCLPPERCVEVEADGVTMVVDLGRSDLLLETEVLRFSEPATRVSPPGKKLYKITPATLKLARTQGFSWQGLSSWFEQRTGLPASPAAKFLFIADETPPLEMRRQIVLHVPNDETADGLLQWPVTQPLLQGRLGPTALIVLEKDVDALSHVLKELGIPMRFE